MAGNDRILCYNCSMKTCRLDNCNKQVVNGIGTVCSMHKARKARHGSFEAILIDRHTRHPLYPRYHAMIERCTKPYSQAWNSYGGRGIVVCDRWLGKDGFKHYLEDIGLQPTPKHTIDRINNNGNYEPGNVRWALMDIQGHNQRGHTATGYKGVYKFRGKFRASITRGNKKIYLGTFTNPAIAYEAYLGARKQLYDY